MTQNWCLVMVVPPWPVVIMCMLRCHLVYVQCMLSWWSHGVVDYWLACGGLGFRVPLEFWSLGVNPSP
jgi:hypothetical protein